MLRQFFIAVSVALAIGIGEARAATFSSERLERLAVYAGLQRLDTLRPGVHDGYRYKQHRVTVRVNKWNEIEHIGLLLFPRQLREINPLPVHDFLERYLLAANAVPANSEYGMKMSWEKVYFAVGNARTALSIDTTAMFTESHVDLHVYKVSWSVADRKVLEMSFQMDYQLLTGLNAIELEQRLFRNLRRYEPQSRGADMPVLPVKGTDYTVKGNYFISPAVRNDLYYKRKSDRDGWSLVSGSRMATRALSNMMLRPESGNGLEMRLKLDKYGLRTDSATVRYSALWQFCKDEGCTPYFGMKGKAGDMYRCTVFMVNRLGGYLHLLSVDIPEQALDDPAKYTAGARIYCYIPLHNVSDKVLNVAEFEPIK